MAVILDSMKIRAINKSSIISVMARRENCITVLFSVFLLSITKGLFLHRHYSDVVVVVQIIFRLLLKLVGGSLLLGQQCATDKV